jgi:thiol-disulfide isomerase/thioredoxin
MKLKICLLGLLCLFFKAEAQPNNSIKYLRSGDKMPDVQITNILNSRAKTSKLSDYKGKLVILDFWSTWCTACVESFPELDSLQYQFAGKLQVLLVNPKKDRDTERGVKIVIDRMKEWSARPFILPVVLQDTMLTRYFEFHSIPTCVWIGQEGTVIAITDKKQVNAANIARIINGEKVALRPKIERSHKPIHISDL